jgi:2-hydroxy-6-oxonona-2,4-dienedioate hydrolase
VIVPDLPGWGRSERPIRPLGIGGAAEVLAEFLGRRREPAAAIVANSFGCQVALVLAQRRPDLVGPLVLLGPTVDPRYRSWWLHAFRLFLDSAREPPALWRILIGDYAGMGFRRLASTARAALEDRPEERFSGLSTPVLVVRGERDAIATLEWASECASRAPHGSFAAVANAAHAAHFSHPIAVARLVETFLAENADRVCKGVG